MTHPAMVSAWEVVKARPLVLDAVWQLAKCDPADLAQIEGGGKVTRPRAVAFVRLAERFEIGDWQAFGRFVAELLPHPELWQEGP